MANKVKSLLGGPGFYAVLALCVLAVGVGGYFLLFGEPAQTEAPTGPDTAASAPVEDLPEHEPVVETVPPEEPEEETERVKALLSDCMSNVVKLRVPLKADVECGHSWFDTK